MKGSALASSKIHGRIHVSGDGFDCNARNHVPRWRFFGKGREVDNWVSEGGQNGAALLGRGESVVLRCDVGFRFLLEAVVKSSGRDEVVWGVRGHAEFRAEAFSEGGFQFDVLGFCEG